jgi:hypothetical protein
MAKDRIYIHDWWYVLGSSSYHHPPATFNQFSLTLMHEREKPKLINRLSPELYLRRPGDERYRLDNLLKRKAEDGVKIFIII